MKNILLCPEDETAPLFVATRENPAFPTRTGAGDYLDLGSIQGLVDETLRFLKCPEKASVKWDRATSRHGVARRTVDAKHKRAVLTPLVNDLNLRLRAGGITKAEAQATLKRATYDAPAAYQLGFSRVVFEHAAVESRVETIIHEACHVAAPVGAGHGPEWASLMVRCGLQPSRTAPAPEGVSVSWSCRSCGKRGTISPAMAAQIALGKKAMCNACGVTLSTADVEVPQHMQRRVIAASRKLQRHQALVAQRVLAFKQALVAQRAEALLPGPQKRCIMCGQAAEQGKKTCGRGECQSRFLAFKQGR